MSAVPPSEATATTDESAEEMLAYWTYAGAAWLARTLPEDVGRWVFDGAAHIAYRLADRTREVVAANQSRVLGRDARDFLVRQSAEEAFELYARYWHDSFRIHAMPADELRARCELTGIEHLRAAIDAGKGCVVALCHQGNWDIAGARVVLEGFRVASVAEELRPRRLFELFRRHREDFGVRIIGLSEARSGTTLADVLAQNQVLALLGDRELGAGGVEVEMFGATRKMPSGPAYLSITTGAPLLFAATATTDRGWRVRLSEPIDVERTDNVREDTRALTRALAQAFERSIAERPADWHLFQPGWPRS